MHGGVTRENLKRVGDLMVGRFSAIISESDALMACGCVGEVSPQHLVTWNDIGLVKIIRDLLLKTSHGNKVHACQLVPSAN